MLANPTPAKAHMNRRNEAIGQDPYNGGWYADYQQWGGQFLLIDHINNLDNAVLTTIKFHQYEFITYHIFFQKFLMLYSGLNLIH